MATPRVVWCSVDNFRQGEVNVIDLYQDNLSELTQTEAVKKHLRTDGGLGYVNPAPYKTGAGIGTPKLLEATPDAESVFFVVCYTRHSMAWCAIYPQGLRCRLAGLLTHHAAHNGGICRSIRPVNEYIDKLSTEGIFRRQRMVTLAGLPKGRPVSSNAGSSNPVNVTAPVEIGTSSGDSLNLLEEAA
ncbi:TPA: ash family protein [Salmonella enterica]|nr:ash family protein [Salmonella enterica]